MSGDSDKLGLFVQLNGVGNVHPTRSGRVNYSAHDGLSVIVAPLGFGHDGIAIDVSQSGHVKISVGPRDSRVIIYDGPFPDENPEITPELFAALVRRSLDG